MVTLQKKWKEEGIKIGEKKGRKDIAINLKRMGLSMDKLVEATGLSEEDIENL